MGGATITPAFLVSTPRAGSTMLAAILSGHSQIHCPPESWLLLELLELRRPRAHRTSPHDSSLAFKAMSEVVGNAWPQAIVQTCIVHYPDTVVMPIPGGPVQAGGGARVRDIGIISRCAA